MRCPPLLLSSLLAASLLIGGPFLVDRPLGQLASADRPDPAAAANAALSVVKPDKGFIDDAFTLSADGSVLFYINTDGASWATLRAFGLPRRSDSPASPTASPAEVTASPTGRPTPPLRLAGSGAAAIAAVPPSKLPVSTLSLEPGSSAELLTGLPLSIIKIALLPDDRVLLVMRDLESLGVVNGSVYSLRSRSPVPIPGISGGSLGPVSEIALSDGPNGPVIITYNRPPGASGSPGSEFTVSAYSASSLKSAGSHSFRLRDDGRMPTAQGSASPLYFIDNYQTIISKHDGLFDKKKDSRQPDFLAFVDALTGRLRRSQPITDPNGLLELARLHKDHSDSQFPLADPESQKIELWATSDRPSSDPNLPVTSRTELTLPRPSKLYDGATLRYQRLRPDRLLLSVSVDPVNEQAIAQRRSDPDDIDFCIVDPAAPAGLRKVRTISGNRRPTEWAASPTGRLVLLRKHKNFPRGGPEIEVYDLDL